MIISTKKDIYIDEKELYTEELGKVEDMFPGNSISRHPKLKRRRI